MANATAGTNDRCPMCGAGLVGETEFCNECGEQLGSRAFSNAGGEKSALQQQYERNLAALQGLLISVGHITWLTGIVMLGITQMPLAGIAAFVSGSAWIAAGYACAYQKHWGILTGLVCSYVTLGGCLLYWNLVGIFSSLILSIQAHRVLRLSHELSAASHETVEED
jgi:hypothetical protein